MMFSIIDNILATINQEQFELLNEVSDIATYIQTCVRGIKVEGGEWYRNTPHTHVILHGTSKPAACF